MNTINSAIVLAQGGNVDSGGLEDFIRQWGDAIQLWGGVALGIVALVFAIILIIKGLAALGKKQTNDAVKFFVFAALVVLVGVIGVGGLYAIVEAIKPVDGNGVTDFMQ